MSFNELGLRIELLKAIKSKRYTTPTLIQTRVIPVILNEQDVLARTQTGTRKTDVFALPLVDILSQQKVKKRYPRVLILTPTRELALQVGESIKAYERRVSIRCTVVYGGVNIGPKIDRLRRGINISLVSHDEKIYLKAIEKLLNRKISREEVAGFTQGGNVPDFILLRSNNSASGKKAGRDIKEIVNKWQSKKQAAKSSGLKTRIKSKPKSRITRKRR